MMPRQPTLAANLSSRLSSQDASFLYNESQSGPLHVGTISVFEGEIPFQAMVRFVEDRLHLVPRYRQKLGFVPFNLAHPVWIDDPEFKIENHVKLHQLSAGTSVDDAIKAALRVHEPPLDRNRPVWEMHLFEGVKGKSVMLWKIHHCLVDGVSGVELTTVMLDFDPKAPPPPPPEQPWKPAPPPSPGELMTQAMRDSLESQVAAARLAQGTLQSREALTERTPLLNEATRSMSQMMLQPIASTPWNSGPVTQRRALALSRYDFADFRAIRAVLGGTVNDVVLTILTEAAARYLAEKGYRTGGLPLRLGCPVSVRREDQGGALGNRVSMMFPALPSTPMDLVARLEAVRAETERIKEARSAQGLELLTEMADTVPPGVVAATSRFATASMDVAAAWSSLAPAPAPSPFSAPFFGINFVATNVPGVQVPQYLAGHECLDTVGLLPLGGSLGYGVAIGSYNQKIYFGMIAEPRVMPDVDVMKAHADDVFEELKQTASAKSAAAA